MSWEGIVLGVFFLGFCIFIHELGHFLAAKWRGLHIIAFSIGFKKVWGFKHNGIDYRIGCIPCGGYVDLPQIDATGEPKDEHGNPLPPAKPIDRIITAIGGPLFNVLFGILLSVVVWYVGVPQDTPSMRTITVQEVDADSPEQKAGLLPGDVITKVNGKSFNCSWGDFVRGIIFTVGDVTLTVKRDGKTLDIKYTPVPNKKRTPKEEIAYPFFIPVIPLKCDVTPGSAVEKAGMKSGDLIVKFNDAKISDYEELRNALGLNNGEEINFTVSRDGEIINLDPIKPIRRETDIYRTGIVISESFNASVMDVEPAPFKEEIAAFKIGDQILQIDNNTIASEKSIGRIIEKSKGKPVSFLVKRGTKVLNISQIFPLEKSIPEKEGTLEVKYNYANPLWIADILPGAPAEMQGFKKYDKLMKLNNQQISSFAMFVKHINGSNGKSLAIEIERGGVVMNKTVTPKKFSLYTIRDIGLQLVITAHPTPLQQFKRVISMTYRSLRGIFSKESTLKARHLSGPIGIFRGIGLTFRHGGIMPVLALIVLITYSLAILNIMPLPVLDGGHIVLALIEQGTGKPLSPKIVQPLFVVFILLLVSMMLYVTFYDAKRLAPTSKEYKYKFLIKKSLQIETIPAASPDK